MRRDGPEEPQLPCGRPQPEDEERGFLWPPTPGELALCVLLFILFFAFSWGGLVLWDEVFINTSDAAAADTVHAVLTGAGRMAVYSAVLAVAAVYIGKGIVIMAKFFANDAGPGPEANAPRTGRGRSGLPGNPLCLSRRREFSGETICKVPMGCRAPQAQSSNSH